MGQSDRDISEWESRLAEQVRRSFHNYRVRRIDLGVARYNKKIDLTGEIIIVEKASSLSASATVRLNFDDAGELDLTQGVEIKSIFGKIYLTNDVQTGEWLDVVTGINFEYKKHTDSEAQPCIILTNVAADANTVAAAHPCNRALIRAHSGNAGTAWINFGADAVADACYDLPAGDVMSVPCSNTNRINGLFTTGGDKVTIVYEV